MNSTENLYASFPFEWSIKSTTYRIRYRKAFDINEIDAIFCTIINAKGNQIHISDLGRLLGFNLQDLAETDILNIYLNSLKEYNLIEINQETIQLTEFGQEALQSKLKYKYFYATTELFENQTATGASFDFSFRKEFDIVNGISHEKKNGELIFQDLELQQKLQFQVFENDHYKGEIVDLLESNPFISYKKILLNCNVTELGNSLEISISRLGVNKPEIKKLIELENSEELKSELFRKGTYHHILANKSSLTAQDITTYIDLWNWKELPGNTKLDWNDKRVFELFRDNGDGSIWSIVSEKAPTENIKSVIQEYAEYWNWTTITQRFEDSFVYEQIENFNWDFEELSYKETEFVISLLSIPTLKNRDWDWNYLSKHLPDEFIEKHIDGFSWDYYLITEQKSEVLRNVLKKGNKNNLEYAKVLLSRPWNWKFISDKFDVNFLYNQLSSLATKLDWHTVLHRFFNNAEITTKCLNDEFFISLLKKHLPDNYIIAHQTYQWSKELIDCFEQQNLIQWESATYINGFDTNENVKWNKDIFKKYHNHITTEKGYLSVSRHITDYTLIQEFPDFGWNWEGISKNSNLIHNLAFVENAFSGNLPFSNNLLWNEILLQSTFDITFWNKHLESFYNTTDSEKHILFWKSLTQNESQDYIFENSHFPWDWHFITEYSSVEIILDSFETEDLFEKWDWEIATRKLDKETILDNLEDLTHFIDWKFLINQVFAVENELSLDNQLPRIAACLSVIETTKRKDIWKYLTAVYHFETLFDYVENTYNLDAFEWDWDFIANQRHFPTDIGTLNKYKEKISWTVLSDSIAIAHKFNPNNWDNTREWFSNTDKYLTKFGDYWDWQVLSKNKHINYNRLIVTKYRNENWDWEYLSEFGGFLTKLRNDNDGYLVQVVSQFPKIRFDFLSKRKDIVIDSDLIRSSKTKKWDWQVLSENEKADISNELLLDLKDKNWNWNAISKRKNIVIDNETLIQLLDKDWDWSYLSCTTNFVFNIEFIEQTKLKPWKWKDVSRHKSFLPTIEILTLTKDFDLDWTYLSQHPNLVPARGLLSKFESKWDWQRITQNPQINFTDFDLIQRFTNKWDWKFICESGQINLNDQILTQFKDYLKWDLISTNTNIEFTKETIQEFKPYWNWTALKENKRVEELLGNYIADEISKSAILTFIDKIEQQWSEWKGYIYHFTHIDNAIEIIKNRKIQSRNKATIKGDAAGNVVHLRNDAHEYARFYFRPHTPTQFYNEFLGKNTSDGYESKQYGWVSWYEKARDLGFPKCPVPIFFRFSLKDVLFRNEKMCCISNGNMQTSSTKFGSVETMINKFGFHDLYYTPEQYATKEDYNRYRNYAQQEFLVKDELLFNNLTDFEIICPSDTDRTLLINLLGLEHKDIFAKIVVNRSYYNNENPRIRVEENESELHISTTFNGTGYFLLNGTGDVKEIDILSGDVSKIDKDKIIFNSYVSIGNIKQNIRLNFIDESGRNWFVYAK